MLQKWSGEVGRPEEATTLLIDTPPELRLQLAEAGPSHLDAVLVSHDHADQTSGFDDIRAFFIKQRRQIPTWIDAATRQSFMQRFGYAFVSEGGYPAIARYAGHLTSLVPVIVAGPGGPLEVLPLEQDHGFSKSLGFRAGDVAYSNDLVAMPEATFAQLGGLRLWIVDALRDTPHPTHAHVDKALEWIARLKPGHALLTNMHIDLDYQALKARLPAGVEPAYDGWAGDYPI
jgi:phosphoribosyl 1,2-cyclic phosphate phosphodiesterase